MVIYAGCGGWLFLEGKQDIVTNSIGGWFCAVNQAFFMGLFLFISAYFVPGSYDRKGAVKFFIDRLVRLGIPLAIYSWIINPLFVYIAFYRNQMSLWQFFPGKYFSYGEYIGQGPLWFIETLLIFSLVYVLCRFLSRPQTTKSPGKTSFPNNVTIFLFALLLGITGFLVRIFLVMDVDRIKALNLQIPFFAQYIALFILGLIAYRHNWFMSLSDKTGRLWLIIAGVMIILWVPMMLTNGAADGEIFQKGGLHWQSLVYALWESFLCISMCIGLIYFFRRFLNHQGKLAKFLIPNAYTAYLIHAVVISTIALAAQNIAIYPLLKFALAAIFSVPICFGLSSLIRKIPYTDRVL
jgi:glucans biosynthesis protein C